MPHWPYCFIFHLGPTTRPSCFLAAAAEGFDGDGFAVEIIELGLVVEGIDVGRSAIHEEEDDALGLGQKLADTGRLRIKPGGGAMGGKGLFTEETVAIKQSGQRDAGEAGAGLPEKFTARAPAKGVGGFFWIGS